MELANLYVQKSKQTLYLGLDSGECYARPYWNGGVDSCLYTTINVETIFIADKSSKEFASVEYLVLDNGETILFTEEQKIFEYYKNKGII